MFFRFTKVTTKLRDFHFISENHKKKQKNYTKHAEVCKKALYLHSFTVFE